MSRLSIDYRVSYLDAANLSYWEVERLLEQKVNDAMLALRRQADALIESFLISGAMPRDLQVLEGEPVIVRWDVWHGDVAHFSVQMPWRIN
jgi:hypothetical protein